MRVFQCLLVLVLLATLTAVFGAKTSGKTLPESESTENDDDDDLTTDASVLISAITSSPVAITRKTNSRTHVPTSTVSSGPTPGSSVETGDKSDADESDAEEDEDSGVSTKSTATTASSTDKSASASADDEDEPAENEADDEDEPAENEADEEDDESHVTPTPTSSVISMVAPATTATANATSASDLAEKGVKSCKWHNECGSGSSCDMSMNDPICKEDEVFRAMILIAEKTKCSADSECPQGTCVSGKCVMESCSNMFPCKKDGLVCVMLKCFKMGPKLARRSIRLF